MARQDIQITSRPGVAAAAAPHACGCCGDGSHGAAPAPVEVGAGAPDRFLVAGMTCGHCVGAVERELAALPGVSAVDITLVAGGTSSVSVTSSSPLARDDVAAAIEEAGYALVGEPGPR